MVRTKLSVRSWRIALTAAFVVNCFLSSEAAESQRKFVTRVELSREEAAKVLRGLAAEIQRNNAHVRSYRGVWECQDRNRVNCEEARKMTTEAVPEFSPCELMRYVRGRVTVELRRNPTQLNCDFEVLSSELQPPDGSAGIQLSGPLLHQRSIVTGQEVYTFEPNIELGELLDPKTGRPPATKPLARFVGRVGFRKPIELAKAQELGVIVDPLDLQRISRDMIEELDMFAKLLEEGVDYSGERIGDVVIPRAVRGTKIEDWIHVIEMTDEAGKKLWRLSIKTLTAQESEGEGSYDFDELVGGLPVEASVLISGRRRQSYIWEYRSDGGAFVPSKTAILRFSKDGTKVTFQRILELLEYSLNEPIPDSAFDWRALGLREGERLVDRISQKILQVDGDRLVPYVANTGPPLSIQNGIGGKLWLVITVNVIVLAAIAFIAFRRSRKLS